MADALSPQALSDLIGSIYDCALDLSRWKQTLADVMGALDCHMLTLALSDLRHHRFLLNKTVGAEPYQMEQLSKHLPEIGTILGEAPTYLPSDEPHLASRHITTTYIETSPFFQEWIKGNGVVDVTHFFLMHTPRHHAGLGLCRNARQGLITEREVELGKLLLPHVRRAVMISKCSMSALS